VTGWNDLPDEMRKIRLDEDTVDRLLSGRMSPDDAPPGYSEVARVLIAVTEDGDSLVHEAEHVAAAAALVEPASASTSRSGSPTKRRSATRLKLGGMVVVGAMVASSGLAAAGALPDAARDTFSRILETVGITEPRGDERPTTGEEISRIATTTDAVGVEKGDEISSTASDGKSRAGQHGAGSDGAAPEEASGTKDTPAESAPPVPVPNEGGTGTADAASGGASEVGTDIADEKSGGASSAGSGNASGKRPARPETPAAEAPGTPADPPGR
jgi:hypothetical protein